ncbi:cold shock and DUF1294 domain-containing protein [Pseudidiomarina sp. 1APR75-33.1]|uniref:cold shock and DUF1294 domain-containing protein n=1 Tax=Pseudidiomarina terrestris TaxID=2820060 RepID=UPI00264D0507|nr:cold shock and DUF1294 domain-containing protein [Pseudidiomarina sp. 1APR75-33.1]MDN7127214.1 cold shock and DUF1294 domain-containing protein [Pseudidiomarina sp. 1APR75-33.1]
MMRKKGTLIKWKAEQGYGFIRPATGSKEIFVHINSFVKRNRIPQIGCVLEYTEQRQRDGKIRAVDVRYCNASNFTFNYSLTFAIVIALIYLAAIVYYAFIGRIWYGYPFIAAAMSVVTYMAYARDKYAAEASYRRTAENTLQLLALIGGWPGALIAQQQFRHKTRKLSFRVVFWLVVLANLVFVWSAIAGLKGILELV